MLRKFSTILALFCLLSFVASVVADDVLTGMAYGDNGIGGYYIAASGTYSIPENATDIYFDLGCTDDDGAWIDGVATGANGSWSGMIGIGAYDPGMFSPMFTITYTLNGVKYRDHKRLNDVTF